MIVMAGQEGLQIKEIEPVDPSWLANQDGL